MDHRTCIKFVCLAVVVGAGGALSACDNGASGSGGSATTSGSTNPTSSGNPTSTGSTNPTSSGNPTSTGSPTGSTSSGSTGSAIMCAMNYCGSVGMGGYDFGYADSQNMSPELPGTSTATLAANGSLCISGNVMQLPMNPTPAEYTNDWGCGLGVNLNQMMGTGTTINTMTLTGTGVTVSTNGVPSCTTARVILDNGGMDYCAPLTDGAEIPWATFNTMCWMPASGMPLSGPPTSKAIKIQFVTSMTEACPFTNFCIDGISL